MSNRKPKPNANASSSSYRRHRLSVQVVPVFTAAAVLMFITFPANPTFTTPAVVLLLSCAQSVRDLPRKVCAPQFVFRSFVFYSTSRDASKVFNRVSAVKCFVCIIKRGISIKRKIFNPFSIRQAINNFKLECTLVIIRESASNYLLTFCNGSK